MRERRHRVEGGATIRDVPAAPPPSYLERLLTELGAVEADFLELLSRSGIVRSTLNDGNSGMVFIGFPEYNWAASQGQLERDRMALLARVRAWEVRFRLLFPTRMPEVTARLDEALGLLERWLVRPGRDHSVPATTDAAGQMLSAQVTVLRQLPELLPDDEWAVRLVPDTNALIDNPDLAAYVGAIGPRYIAHVMPVVMRELDELKRSGRTEPLREAARAADRRLKGLRDNGDVQVGVRVAGAVHARFEHADPRSDGLPNWLDLTVPDDRLIGAVMLLQSQHPRSAVYVATSDLNLQTKLAAVGVPFVEPP